MKRIFNGMPMLRLKYASGLHQMKNENINLLITFCYCSERVEKLFESDERTNVQNGYRF